MAVAATKTDAAGEGELLDILEKYCKTNNIDLFPISAATHQGLEELLIYLSG